MVNMDNKSPFLAMQRVEGQIQTVLRHLDPDTLDTNQRKAVGSLKRLAIDTRLDVRDYELSETRVEQVENAVAAKNRLAKLQQCILISGDVFGPVDVAHLSAQLEQINGWLK
jgi:hypothetical protein